ncbi:MAG: sugar phosphate isomerase/epimerase [Lentisphaeria bacterium]|nr:sugar phosphate isomerase/epimerase [Lentisphaeria bacterium]
MASKIAVQLFTVRDFTKTAADFASTLEKVSKMGYTAVQMSAVGAVFNEKPEVSPDEAGKMLADNGLTCIATHRSWDALMNNTEKEIDFHKALNCDFAAIGGIPQNYGRTAEGYRQFLKDAGPVIEKLAAAGIRFGHHNHAHEFQRVPGEKITLEDILIDESPAALNLELDLYWVEHAGLNCCRILERCHGRVPVIHLKDKEVDNEEGPVMAPIGEGNMDWAHIIPACEAAGVEWYAVEQDRCRRDPFDCLRSSFDFLAGMGL